MKSAISAISPNVPLAKLPDLHRNTAVNSKYMTDYGGDLYYKQGKVPHFIMLLTGKPGGSYGEGKSPGMEQPPMVEGRQQSGINRDRIY